RSWPMTTQTCLVNDSSTSGNIPAIEVTLVQNADGTVTFTITQLVYEGAYLGDLRGIFFDIAREELIGTLTVVGATNNLTELQQGDDAISNLGQGSNMEGLLGSDGGYDVGIEIGTSGTG